VTVRGLLLRRQSILDSLNLNQSRHLVKMRVGIGLLHGPDKGKIHMSLRQRSPRNVCAFGGRDQPERRPI